ncbi:hypothetical protein [Clostridium botulinum]|uniref:hypothetical protein n=1 Tax=Clostridium botulinum TaxID=1491 RepID=UPI000774267D|nr:hypothetical protein [Clostridium botulinum]MBN3352143.1 hypothetical protein [Clostridium botulinum]
MGEDIFLDKLTVYIDGQPCDASIDKTYFENIEENQSNNIQNTIELLNKPISIELANESIKACKSFIEELTYKAQIINLINIYDKTKKFRIKKKLTKRINELLAKP